MSNFNFTPSPWKYTYSKRGRHQISGVEGMQIVSVWKGRHTEGNCRMIAAAPKMLRGLIYFVRRVHEGSIRSRTTFNLYADIIEEATDLPIHTILHMTEEELDSALPRV